MRQDQQCRTTDTRTPRPLPHHTRRRRRPWCLLPFLALLLCVRSAAADGAGPTLADLERHPAFELKTRYGMWGPQRDFYETDGGEVRYELVGDPVLEVVREHWETRHRGMVRSCPSKKNSATVTVEVSTSDSTGWQHTGTTGLELELFEVLTMKGATTRATSQIYKIEEVASVSHHIEAGWCHMIDFAANLKLGDYRLHLKFKKKRRYAWWTKNAYTGATVHAKGDVWVDSGTATLVLSRRAALEIGLDFDDAKCPDPGCGGTTTPSPADPPPPPPGSTPVTGGTDESEQNRSPPVDNRGVHREPASDDAEDS